MRDMSIYILITKSNKRNICLNKSIKRDIYLLCGEVYIVSAANSEGDEKDN